MCLLSLRLSAARYNVTTLHTGDGDDPECFASGGYPKGQIRWFDGDSQEMTENATMEERQTEEGLFLLSSKLNLQKGFVSSSCTCAVYNASGVREQENTFKFYPEGMRPFRLLIVTTSQSSGRSYSSCLISTWQT